LNGDGYDLVLLGRVDDSPIDVDRIQQRVEQKGYSRVLASLGEVQFESATDLMATYAGRAEDLRPMTQNVEINRDLNMRLQYLAGLGLNSVTTSQVYRKILSYRRFPEDLIKGSGESIETLRDALGRPHRTF
jgi:spermidine synthase